jgi:ATP-dependent RNA helicase RhlE
MTFAELGLSKNIQETLIENEFTAPFPIQETAIPAILSRKDVLGIAQTGSGKTASYILPILQLLQKKSNPKNRFISALVLVPTRELAVQVATVCKLFSANLSRPVKSLAVFGGVSINPQMIGMQGVEILIATPGRLLDLHDKKAMNLSEIEFLVLDEADKMLNLGFKEEMESIFKLLPYRRQNLLFSATLGKDIDTISEIILHNPLKIEIAAEEENLDLIEQLAYALSEDQKGPFLRKLIKEKGFDQVLVFASSTHRADAIVAKLKTNGLKALAMHSKKSQGARTDALRYFKQKEINILVATDLMSRGIDIPNLPLVINYELPRSPKDYIHRIGRTGRAGIKGEAISFISEDELHHFAVIQKKIKRHITLVQNQQEEI